MNSDAPHKMGVGRRIGFLAKDSLLYGSAYAFMKGMAFITFPIMTRHFDPAQYGIIDYYGFAIALIAVVLAFGLDQTIARFFYDDDDVNHRKQVISQALLLNLIALFPVLTVIYLVSGHLTRFAPVTSDTQTLINLILATAPFMVITAHALNICKWTFARKRYLALAVGSAILRVGVLVTLILVFDVSVVGIFWMNLGLSAVSALMGIVFIVPWLSMPRPSQLMISMCTYAPPLWMLSVLALLTPVIERTITESLFGNDALGMYAAGAKVALLMGLALIAFQMSWGPLAYAIHKEPDANKTYRLVMKLFTLGSWTMALGLGAVAPLMLALLAPSEYAAGASVTLPLAIAACLLGMTNIVNTGLALKKRPYLNIPSKLGSIAVGLPAMYLLGGEFGIFGVALGAAVATLTGLLIAAWINTKVIDIDWPIKGAAAACLWGLLAASAIEIGRAWLPPSLAYPLSGVMVLLFFTTSFFTIMSKDERNAFTFRARQMLRMRSTG